MLKNPNITKEEAEKFIKKVFNFYNGKINTRIKCKLIISYDTDILSNTRIIYGIGFVKVYIENTLNYYKARSIKGFKYQTIYDIISALSQAEQFVDFYMYQKDHSIYAPAIHLANERKIERYMHSEREEIFNTFGIDVDMHLQYKYMDGDELKYVTINNDNYNEYIVGLLKAISLLKLNNPKLIYKLDECLLYDSTIKINIDFINRYESYTIKENSKFIDINDLHSMAQKVINMNNAKCCTKYIHDEDNNFLKIKITYKKAHSITPKGDK